MKRLEVPVPPNVETASGSTRRVRWHHPRKGVSDIIGNLLIIAITVTLFTALFFFVTSIPAPPAQSTSQFSAQLDIQGPNEVGVNITYLTGPILGAGAIQIYLTSQLHPTAFTGCSPAGDPFTIPEGLLGASTWVSGQTWQLHFVRGTNAGDICHTAPALSANGDNVTISIVNIAQNVLLFRVVLPGSHAIFPPEFLNEGTMPSNPVQDSNFTVFAQVVGADLNDSSVYANLSSLCSQNCPYPRPVQMHMYQGLFVLNVSATYSNELSENLSTNYPIVINATNINATNSFPSKLTNSVVFYVSFTSSVIFPSLTVTVSLSQGNPRVDQSVTVTATVTNANQVGGSGLKVSFAAHSENGASGKISTSTLGPYSIGPAGTVTAPTTWTPPSDGAWIVYANATMSSATIKNGYIGVTVFPRTLLIDETDVTPGSNSSLDTFTYVATDFSSAGVPFNVSVVSPGTSPITWTGTSKNSLDMYDVIVWVLSNGATLQSSDVSALQSAIQGQRSVWLLGADALAGSSVNTLYGYFGVAQTPTLAAIPGPPGVLPLALTTPIGLPGFQTAGIDPTNLSFSGCLGVGSSTECPNGPSGLFSQSDYMYIPKTGVSGTPILQVGTTTDVVMVGDTTLYGGKTITSPFELATITQQMPGKTGPYVTSTAQQASLVYDTFNWLANFTSQTRQGNDWAISQVVVQPPQLSYQHQVAINFTARNNGPGTGSVVATLNVNGFAVYSNGEPIAETILTVPPGGGEVNGTLYWTPSFVGFLTLGVQLTTQEVDTDPGNNFMAQSLFSKPLYVQYSVLLVDATGGSKPDTTGLIYNALNQTGFPAGTVTLVRLSSTCASLPSKIQGEVAAAEFNMVIWNAGEVVNNSKGGAAGTCPLSSTNSQTLSAFLNVGGGSSSLLFIGNGLLSDYKAGDTQVEQFASTYLGFSTSLTGTAIQSITPDQNLYGMTGDNIGDGVDLPLALGVATSTNYTFSDSYISPPTAGLVASPAFEFNSKDYWTPSHQVAAADAYSPVGHWHTAWWGFDVASVTSPSLLALTMLRTATDLGRLVPNSDTVLGPPDITFATATSPYTNFDQMNPQLDQQYLVRFNITNLGGAPAYNLAVTALDGDHILGVESLTVGGATVSGNSGVQLGVATASLSWTPLYAGTNPITVEITSSTATQILPGVTNSATWSLTVYFFYDNMSNNVNSWTHSNMMLWQALVPSPGGCFDPPVGQQIYYWDDQNVPNPWPSPKLGGEGCPPYTTTNNLIGPLGEWGVTAGICHQEVWYCASLAVNDTISNPNGPIQWQASSTFTLSPGLTSAVASWWQQFDLAPFENGGVVCVNSHSLNCWQKSPQPAPGYTGTINYYTGSRCDNNIASFTGPSGGGSGGWVHESLNLSGFIGQPSVTIYFGYIQGDNGQFCDGSTTHAGTGWYIDDFRVLVSGYANQGILKDGQGNGYNCGSEPGQNIPNDLWSLVPNAGPSGYLSLHGFPNPAPTGHAWVAGNLTSSGMLMLDPNMWDSLYTRPIDLTQATSATLTFNYLWSRNPTSIDPPMGFVLEISPVLANGQAQWVQVWNANLQPSGTIPFDNKWNNATVPLNGYVGEVIQLRFLVGTNCGGDGDGYVPYSYPLPSPSAAMLSGIEIAGSTSISPTVASVLGEEAASPVGPSPSPQWSAHGSSAILPREFPGARQAALFSGSSLYLGTVMGVPGIILEAGRRRRTEGRQPNSWPHHPRSLTAPYRALPRGAWPRTSNRNLRPK